MSAAAQLVKVFMFYSLMVQFIVFVLQKVLVLTFLMTWFAGQPVTLELGGKSPIHVFDDDDIDKGSYLS